MKKTLELKKPIRFNGKMVKKLSYDPEEIDGALFARAENAKQNAGMESSTLNLNMIPQTDYLTQLYLGYASIIAVNPEYEFTDLEQIKGSDIMEVQMIGRNFTLGILGDKTDSSQEEISEDAGETTQESTTPQ